MSFFLGRFFFSSYFVRKKEITWWLFLLIYFVRFFIYYHQRIYHFVIFHYYYSYCLFSLTRSFQSEKISSYSEFFLCFSCVHCWCVLLLFSFSLSLSLLFFKCVYSWLFFWSVNKISDSFQKLFYFLLIIIFFSVILFGFVFTFYLPTMR